ncbi:Histidine triad nucleotide-binding protein 3 [Platysternon megacephalum]|uniref:Histidine triad nucleotide-binding protein 3 n=1 Tax=Platysternon megacephalum TaxID=55544 RepID=A0A4D9DHB0_9SAUR|nr:Histidine triad nucleotide-binding protein 3 [Platysternon megacephalum]
MGNCKTLKKEHIPLVEKMMEAGKNILQQNNFTDLNDIRYITCFLDTSSTLLTLTTVLI